MPIAGYAYMCAEDTFILDGLVANIDGTGSLRARCEGKAAYARQSGLDLAAALLKQGAAAILQKLYSPSEKNS